MRLGIEVPSFGPEAGPAAIATIAETADRLGFHGISVSDRLLLPLNADWQSTYGLPDFAVLDLLETLTFVAARTERVRLTTAIANSLFQPPVVLARRFATLDVLSGGRVNAGIGLGWMPEEFAAAGVPMERRADRFEEHLAAMRACWAADPVAFHGEFYEIPLAKVGPKPVRGFLPVLIGGLARPAVERAARLGDGFIAAVRDWAVTRKEISWYREAGGSGPVVIRCAPGWADFSHESPAFGDAVREEVERTSDAGGDELHWGLQLAGFEVSRQVEVLHAIAELGVLAPTTG